MWPVVSFPASCMQNNQASTAKPSLGHMTKDILDEIPSAMIKHLVKTLAMPILVEKRVKLLWNCQNEMAIYYPLMKPAHHPMDKIL